MIVIREELPGDADVIRSLTIQAFRDAPHSSGTEAAIIDALRNARGLAVSLVAETPDNSLIGHVAFSPVSIDGAAADWYGLGPVAVRPDRQKLGVGAALIEAGLDRLKQVGAGGCVVLGDPAYYRRFGFASDPALAYADVPAEYFQRLVFPGSPPAGKVAYHPAFEAVA